NRFEQRLPQFMPIKTGSNTAYNSYDKLPRIQHAIKEYNVGRGDYVFLSYGEIDIRHHIGFNADRKNVPVDVAIIECVARYMKTLNFLKGFDFKIGAYGPIASQKGSDQLHPEYRDVKFRNSMTLRFNEILKEFCEMDDLLFKTIADKMIDQNGLTYPQYI